MHKITTSVLLVFGFSGGVFGQPCTVGVACAAETQQITVPITAAQILDSVDNPVELVAAPGAGFVIAPLRVIKAAGAGAAYSDTATVQWDGGSDIVATVGFADDFDTYTAAQAGGALAEFENKALVLLGGAAIDDDSGAIASASIGTGGADYEVGDTGAIDGGNDNAEYEVDTVDAGAVTAFTLTVSGSGYAVADGVATSAGSGIGTGFEIDIDSITLGSRPVSLTIVYSIAELP